MIHYPDWEALRRSVDKLDPQRFNVLIRVAEALGKIGPRAAELLGDEAEGLEMGAHYGDLGPGRNLVFEARQEARDGRIYVADELGRARARVRALEVASMAFEEAHGALVEAAE